MAMHANLLTSEMTIVIKKQIIRIFLMGIVLTLFSKVLLTEAIWSNSSSCIEMEREALLQFKQGLKDPSGRLSSWVGEDCCSWVGVGCSNQTGHVLSLELGRPLMLNMEWLCGTLHSALLNLTHLNYLDLSYNDFQGNQIPNFIGAFTELRYLDLGEANFSGMIPSCLGNLTNLQHLYLSMYPKKLWVSDLNWLSGLSSLQHLKLKGIDLSKVSANWLQAINTLPALLELDLSDCQLQNLPESPSLVNFTSLMYLDLSYNNFSSKLPQWLSNTSALHIINIRDSNLIGSINEVSLEKFCDLQAIDLSYNEIHGDIEEVLKPLSECGNHSLSSLDFSSNEINGNFPDSLGLLTNLEILLLHHNSVAGPVPTSIGNLSHLSELYLSYNMIKGPIPQSIGQLKALIALELFRNPWEGIITENHFQNLTKLRNFYLSSTSNSLVFRVRQDWIPPFSLHFLIISDCMVGPNFPTWLQTQYEIFEIELSNVSISSPIPDWLWQTLPWLDKLDLSNNQLVGKLPSSKDFRLKQSSVIDLGFNYLSGSVPLWPNVSFLILRNNSFSGPIPPSIGHEMAGLTVLDLSGNNLNGNLPFSMKNMTNLTILDLSSNNLSGKISKQLNGLQELRGINLSKNNLSGNIPSFVSSQPYLLWLKLSNNNLSGSLVPLQNFSNLSVLDLGRNSFSGDILKWIAKNLYSLSYIRLQSNLLTGNIPEELCQFPSLHILDLADNNLSGSIPKCLGSLVALKSLDMYLHTEVVSIILGSYYQQLELVVKGSENQYSKMVALVNTIDLSSNNLTGEIPEEITKLSSLGFLNLSRNQLTGKIPENVGRLQRLESLDLSHNHLSGPIPTSMSSMTLLNYLILSYNNFSGQIPSSTQFQTFNESSFEGNPDLCGPPLSTNCSSTNDPSAQGKNEGDGEEDEGGIDRLSFLLSMGLGFVVGLWAVCGSLAIKQSWRIAFFKFLDEKRDWLYVVIVVNIASFRRKMGRQGQ